MTDIKDTLRAARLAVGKTQEAVAIEAGMHVTQYNGYERGRSRPAFPTLERLAVALKTTVAALSSDIGQISADDSNVQEMVDALRKAVASALGVPATRITLSIGLD